jgi:hypothetical protein
MHRNAPLSPMKRVPGCTIPMVPMRLPPMAPVNLVEQIRALATGLLTRGVLTFSATIQPPHMYYSLLKMGHPLQAQGCELKGIRGSHGTPSHLLVHPLGPSPDRERAAASATGLFYAPALAPAGPSARTARPAAAHWVVTAAHILIIIGGLLCSPSPPRCSLRDHPPGARG